jgi:hypothetical protein
MLSTANPGRAAATNEPPGEEFVLPSISPPSPVRKSPVTFFRELLAMSPEGQKVYLADRSPDNQRRILAKLREYETLRPSQRELKLRATELQWYLSPLLEMPATNRAAQLQRIPEEQRRLVESRLKDWDILPPDARKDLLDNAATLRYFTQVEPITEEQKRALLETLSAGRRKKLEAGIAHWQELPVAQRQRTLKRFNKFFDLTSAEKERSLATLSDEERRQMEKTLHRFEQLPAAQRQECMQVFTRFTSLSVEERQQFLKNAERWQLMSPEERQDWRELVQKLAAAQPPMPPGTHRRVFPSPPAPPTTLALPASAVATNDRK